jgi:hypothetical protein
MGGHNNKEIPFPADAPERAERLYTEGAVDQAVAEHFGVSRQIIYLWRSRDDKFDAACDRGKRAGEAIRAAIISAAARGERRNCRSSPPQTRPRLPASCALWVTPTSR